MSKVTKLAPFQKLLTIMISGKPVMLTEIDTLLGKEIYMYRMSTYMWHIKVNANGVVKPIKEGRKVIGYQIMNVNQVKDYMNLAGISGSNFTPGSVEKKPSISKLADLKAVPVVKEEPIVQSVEIDEMTVTEVTEAVEV
jgi:hypothetical protein